MNRLQSVIKIGMIGWALCAFAMSASAQSPSGNPPPDDPKIANPLAAPPLLSIEEGCARALQFVAKVLDIDRLVLAKPADTEAILKPSCQIPAAFAKQQIKEWECPIELGLSDIRVIPQPHLQSNWGQMRLNGFCAPQIAMQLNQRYGEARSRSAPPNGLQWKTAKTITLQEGASPFSVHPSLVLTRLPAGDSVLLFDLLD